VTGPHFSSSAGITGCHAVSSTSLLVKAWCWLCLILQGSKGYTRGANMRVPTMSSRSLFLEKVRWPQSWPTTKKPVKAVPAMNHDTGRRYQGVTEMR